MPLHQIGKMLSGKTCLVIIAFLVILSEGEAGPVQLDRAGTCCPASDPCGKEITSGACKLCSPKCWDRAADTLQPESAELDRAADNLQPESAELDRIGSCCPDSDPCGRKHSTFMTMGNCKLCNWNIDCRTYGQTKGDNLESESAELDRAGRCCPASDPCGRKPSSMSCKRCNCLRLFGRSAQLDRADDNLESESAELDRFGSCCPDSDPCGKKMTSGACYLCNCPGKYGTPFGQTKG